MSTVAHQPRWMNDELWTFRQTVRHFIQEQFVSHQAHWRQQYRPDAEPCSLPRIA
jgi:hypothetical protein